MYIYTYIRITEWDWQPLSKANKILYRLCNQKKNFHIKVGGPIHLVSWRNIRSLKSFALVSSFCSSVSNRTPENSSHCDSTQRGVQQQSLLCSCLVLPLAGSGYWNSFAVGRLVFKSSLTYKLNMENENKYLPQLLAERDSLDASFTHAMKLLSAGNCSSFSENEGEESWKCNLGTFVV